MTPLQAMRAAAAEERRQQRAAQIRQRELARQMKEQEKLSAQQQARLEVDAFENQLEVLLSVHKGESPPFDWQNVVNEAPPLPPVRLRLQELRAIWEAARNHGGVGAGVDEARNADDALFQAETQAYRKRLEEWTRLRTIAQGVLNGEEKAYIDALLEMNPFEEIGVLGSVLHFTVHSKAVLEAGLKVNGRQSIPTHIKSLTASGKLSTKAMPRVRFQEIYQDYVCSCALRVAREAFALLPVRILLLTASAEMVDSGTGKFGEQPVLSVIFERDQLRALDFERIDPSDAVERFQHRGDFKASRKLEAFAPIIPLGTGDLPVDFAIEATLEGALTAVRRVRSAIDSARDRIRSHEVAEASEGSSVE
ncbi:MAG: hypothetical protein JNK85_17935 [Verrucomicrobiales bacterium]|nr:hypothetical protein [Verrucomicrobiales bacterium]